MNGFTKMNSLANPFSYAMIHPILYQLERAMKFIDVPSRIAGVFGAVFLALLLVSPAKYMVVGLAAVDALADLRRLLRMASPPTGKD